MNILVYCGASLGNNELYVETATFHWKDGTSDKVEFMALKNNEYPDMLPRYYMVYFLNGKQTAFPIVIVR